LIVIDAVAIGPRGKGNGRVLLNLLTHLPLVDKEHRYAALVTPFGADALRSRVPNLELRLVQPRRALRWELHGVARAAADADLLVTVRELLPLSGPPVFVHIFEPPAYRLFAQLPLSRAEVRRLAKDALLAAVFTRSLSRAATVTAGSRDTADWLRQRGVEAEVVLPGIDPVFLQDAEPTPSYEPYILHPASGDPRENTDLVLKAFATGRCNGLRLVLVGAPERLRPALERRAHKLSINAEVAGWVTDEELRDLYRRALALAHPSRYEAYVGLQALEAMALGTPVVGVDGPGSSEVLADVGVVVPRPDPQMYADALARLRDDPGLRSELSKRARALARTLTWDASARAFARAFPGVLEMRN
jgi:glycosyltransferase involved in cell wall biosynthesis